MKKLFRGVLGLLARIAVVFNRMFNKGDAAANPAGKGTGNQIRTGILNEMQVGILFRSDTRIPGIDSIRRAKESLAYDLTEEGCTLAAGAEEDHDPVGAGSANRHDMRHADPFHGKIGRE